MKMNTRMMHRHFCGSRVPVLVMLVLTVIGIACSCITITPSWIQGIDAFSTTTTTTNGGGGGGRRRTAAAASTVASLALSSSTATQSIDTQNPTDLPDSLVDAAERAALACYDFSQYDMSNQVRCRVDFDTSAGDETFPILKTSTEFMQHFVSFLTYQYVPGLMQEKQQNVQRVAEARVKLQQILQQEAQQATENENDTGDGRGIDLEAKKKYMSILQNGGKLLKEGHNDEEEEEDDGPIVRVYFPDEGNAALATRDWTATTSGIDIPDCVRFNSCGSVQASYQDTTRDCLIFFFCPKASESEFVEEILRKTELSHAALNTTQQLLTVMVNPNLVDMGVTGFGMAGRMLRERLLDGLTGTYYLRTLQWGALTRKWPNAYSLWEEDDVAEGGYNLLRTLPYLPSNPDVEDIYDEMNAGKIQVDENGNVLNPRGPNLLDQFGDFVNGMMRL